MNFPSINGNIVGNIQKTNLHTHTLLLGNDLDIAKPLFVFLIKNSDLYVPSSRRLEIVDIKPKVMEVTTFRILQTESAYHETDSSGECSCSDSDTQKKWETKTTPKTLRNEIHNLRQEIEEKDKEIERLRNMFKNMQY